MDTVEAQLLRHVWHPVARCSDVVGEHPATARLLDIDLVVYRAGATIVVADDRCPHRGAALSLGRLKDDALECAYHGWRYGPNGTCVAVPSLRDGGSRADVCLRTHRAVERYGHVWTCLEEPVLPIPEIAELDTGDWELLVGEPFEVACGIRAVTENFHDISHLPYVHENTIGAGVDPHIHRYQVTQDGWSLSYTSPFSFGGRLIDADAQSTELIRNQARKGFTIVLPAVGRSGTDYANGGKRMTVQLVAPLTVTGRQTSRVFWALAFNRIALEGMDGDFAATVGFERRIFEEDLPILETLRPAEASLELQDEEHTAADKFSVAYRQAYARLLAEYADGTLAPEAPPLAAVNVAL